MAFTEYRIQVIFRSNSIYFEHKILKKNSEFQIDTFDSISDWSTISRPEFDWLIDHLTMDNMGHQFVYPTESLVLNNHITLLKYQKVTSYR